MPVWHEVAGSRTRFFLQLNGMTCPEFRTRQLITRFKLGTRDMLTLLAVYESSLPEWKLHPAAGRLSPSFRLA